MEERRPAKGNMASKTRPGHRAGQGALSALDRVREVARKVCAFAFGPKARAQCVSSARWDLCGGPPARAVPTATRPWRCSREELSGVGGVERSEGDGGNWGGPPRPKRIAVSVDERVLVTGEEPGSGGRVGRESEAVVVPVEPRDNITRGEGRAAASLTRMLGATDW